ncbi:hypothetical protein ADL35_38720, partial [Streptomyces sp. NRRL WC-3753]
AEELHRLPEAPSYAVKPVAGADSMGLEFLPRGEVAARLDGGVLAQPRVDFRYEVSFFYVDREFRYALYAPDPGRRWELAPYEATPADLAFAGRFVEWNGLTHGVTRVDACRTRAGELLLVELEDLNPYLSLDLLGEEEREGFVAALKRSLRAFIAQE